MSEVSNQVEALLFSSGGAMNIEDVANIMNLEKKEVKKALKELKERYDSSDGSIMVTEEGDSWKLNIKEKYVSLVMKIVADTEMSKTVLETLSVIAWKSPVLQSKVIKIRTSNAYEHIKELVDAGFINKEREGRSYRLRIAEKFFEYFDVPGDKGIKDAFKGVKIPEKKEPEHLGKLEVVPIEEKEPPKEEIPPIDEEFLSKVNKQIEIISAKNDELEQDELFKRKADDTEVDTSEVQSEPEQPEEGQEVDEVISEEESPVDEYVKETDSTADKSQEESPEQVEEELSEETKEFDNENLEELEKSLEEGTDEDFEEEKKKKNVSS